MSGTSSSWRWAYAGEVEQWAEDEVERELAEMTGSLEQLAVLEGEGEGEECGSPGHRSESEADCSELFARVSAARAVFLEGARSFLDSSAQEVQRTEEGICCVLCLRSLRVLSVASAAASGLLGTRGEDPSTQQGAAPRELEEVGGAYTGADERVTALPLPRPLDD